MLCGQALNPPLLGDTIIELGKFCFIETNLKPNLSYFSKPVTVAKSAYFQHQVLKFSQENTQ